MKGRNDSKATRQGSSSGDMKNGDREWANSSPSGLRGGAGIEKGSERGSAERRSPAGRGGGGEDVDIVRIVIHISHG